MTQKINEFCVKGNLEEFRNILQDIFHKIEKGNCTISARYDSEISSHVDSIIRISLLPIYKKPLHILWTILHEFGHCLSGAIDKKDEYNLEVRIASEEKAWEYAEKELLKFPVLLEWNADFKNYKNECLKTYYNKRITCGNTQYKKLGG